MLRIQRCNGLDATPMANSRINDQLIKCIHSLIRCVLSSSASYFVVCCFQHKIFNISKSLNHVAPSVELMMRRWAIWYEYSPRNAEIAASVIHMVVP